MKGGAGPAPGSPLLPYVHASQTGQIAPPNRWKHVCKAGNKTHLFFFSTIFFDALRSLLIRLPLDWRRARLLRRRGGGAEGLSNSSKRSRGGKKAEESGAGKANSFSVRIKLSLCRHSRCVLTPRAFPGIPGAITASSASSCSANGRRTIKLTAHDWCFFFCFFSPPIPFGSASCSPCFSFLVLS